jgi:CBS domain containing-hemolysin-like protein
VNNSVTGVILLVGFILLNALLKLAYVALINAHKSRLKDLAEEGNPRARRALALAEDATRLLASQQVIDLLLRFLIAVVAADVLAPPLRETLVARDLSATLADLIAYGGVLIVAAFFTLIFGEMLPAAIALGHTDAIAVRVVGLIRVLSLLLAPVLRLSQWVSHQIAAPLVGKSSVALVTEEEIMLLVDAGSEGGAIEDEEKEMIYSIFQFGDTLARELMVPRIDVVALEMHTLLTEALDTIVKAGHSRIPVYEDSIDHIRGLLYAKDLLQRWRDGQTDGQIKDLLRPAHFVPESKKAVDLLADLQQRKIHLAIVVDEYGGTAGLVTLEDLLEEIVGEIRDEYDFDEEEAYQQVSDYEYIFDAGIDLDDLNRLLELELATEDSDTLGGYIFSKLGKVPIEGERLEDGRLTFQVLRVDDRRIRKIRLTLAPPPPAVPEDIREEPAASPD